MVQVGESGCELDISICLTWIKEANLEQSFISGNQEDDRTAVRSEAVGRARSTLSVAERCGALAKVVRVANFGRSCVAQTAECKGPGWVPCCRNST